MGAARMLGLGSLDLHVILIPPQASQAQGHDTCPPSWSDYQSQDFQRRSNGAGSPYLGMWPIMNFNTCRRAQEGATSTQLFYDCFNFSLSVFTAQSSALRLPPLTGVVHA
ncbi:hypothetical protein BDN67DRAFT_974871 [Paxillus ammoniavirescens]|nr:hypothetical protein BDN67DRAFT_974871 [Paxillus ammoniavirescens]